MGAEQVLSMHVLLLLLPLQVEDGHIDVKVLVYEAQFLPSEQQFLHVIGSELLSAPELVIRFSADGDDEFIWRGDPDSRAIWKKTGIWR